MIHQLPELTSCTTYMYVISELVVMMRYLRLRIGMYTVISMRFYILHVIYIGREGPQSVRWSKSGRSISDAASYPAGWPQPLQPPTDSRLAGSLAEQIGWGASGYQIG